MPLLARMTGNNDQKQPLPGSDSKTKDEQPLILSIMINNNVYAMRFS
jgi:hypothetical protein